MVGEPFRPEDLRALTRARTPIWVYDLDRRRTWWANPAALALFAAESLEEHQARQAREPLSEGMVRRIESYRAAFARGESVVERWTFYPEGRGPVAAICECSALDVEDEAGPRVAMLVEARPAESDVSYELRLAEAALHASECISLYDSQGALLARNPAAKLIFGDAPPGTDALAAAFADPETGHAAKAVAWAGGVFHAETQANALYGGAWYQTEARRVTDPVSGAPALLVVQHDVSDRRATEARLTEASRAKSAFLATMSHELRTPMTGVLAAAELLRGSALDGDQTEALDMVQVAGEQMVALIDDVLDISRIEAGRIQLHVEPISITDAVQGTLRSLAAAAARKGLQLRHETAPGVPQRAMSDRKRLGQILTNLVGNAIKFTHEGSVTVRVDQIAEAGRQPWLTFEVEDTGVGIDPAQLDAVFRPFEQADASSARAFGGAGLGLHIARSLAEVLGGTLQVRSTRGEGSTFTLRLPYRAAPERQSEPAPKKARGALGLRVLVAEDNALNRRALVRLLRRWGCTVDQAADGGEAIAIARESVPDVVLMDINMPGTDGPTAARALREAGLTSAIVALTADAFFEGEPSFDRKLTKPVDWDVLYEVLEAQVRATARSPS